MEPTLLLLSPIAYIPAWYSYHRFYVGSRVHNLVKRKPWKKPKILTMRELDKKLAANWTDEFVELISANSLHKLLDLSEVPDRHGSRFRAICTCKYTLIEWSLDDAVIAMDKHFKEKLMLELEV